MVEALRAAADCFEGAAEATRSVVYLGDGISRANLLEDDEVKDIVSRLIERRASVSSYVIGPQRDLILPAVMANHTGGMLYVDTDAADSAQQAGVYLANAVTKPVFWPTLVQLPDNLVEHYPSNVPPLRIDRDTILIGKLEGHGLQSVKITAEVAGKVVDLTWSVEPERSNEDFGFLPRLVDLARDNGGLTLPTLGSDGLRATSNELQSGSSDLSSLPVSAPRNWKTRTRPLSILSAWCKSNRPRTRRLVRTICSRNWNQPPVC